MLFSLPPPLIITGCGQMAQLFHAGRQSRLRCHRLFHLLGCSRGPSGPSAPSQRPVTCACPAGLQPGAAITTAPGTRGRRKAEVSRKVAKPATSGRSALTAHQPGCSWALPWEAAAAESIVLEQTWTRSPPVKALLRETGQLSHVKDSVMTWVFSQQDPNAVCSQRVQRSKLPAY